MKDLDWSDVEADASRMEDEVTSAREARKECDERYGWMWAEDV